MNAASPSQVSYEDYFLAETMSESKHEWSDGVVYAMSRGTPEHAALQAAMTRLLGNALHGKCRVYGPDAMLYVDSAKLSTYADVSVVCGALETKRVLKNGKSLGEAITNPCIIVEVLSEATERYDRDGKFNAYKQVGSLRWYVLVSQDERSIEVYRRDEAGAWSVEVAVGGKAATIHGAKIDVDAVYG